MSPIIYFVNFYLRAGIMARRSQAEKAESRAKILDAAAKLIREGSLRVGEEWCGAPIASVPFIDALAVEVPADRNAKQHQHGGSDQTQKPGR